MHRRLVLTILTIMAATSTVAVPAKRVRTWLRLSNGTKVEATLSGDEHLHYYLTDDGQALMTEADGDIARFVSLDSLSAIHTERLAKANTRRIRKQMKMKQTRAWGDEMNPITGSKRGLVILVNFADRQLTYSRNDFNNFFNQSGYQEFGMQGSVRDYFLDQSYGQLVINFDIAGPITLSKDMSYYGKNDSNGEDLHPGEMITEACRIADAEVNFADYDWDGDGWVDQVYIIYAGYGESQGAGINTIWPHEWTLTEAAAFNDGEGPLSLDGVEIDTYACSCELAGHSGSTIDGVGSACHEFSHCLCLPDMYDTIGSAPGMMDWDVMDHGCYNGDGNGRCPASYTSYERMYCGWLRPNVLAGNQKVENMQPITSAPEAYIIYNSACAREYYLIENHQHESWDTAAYGHGMLILHVDFDPNAWIENTVNTQRNHQRMTIIPADNRLLDSTVSQLAGDPWPGTKGMTELNANTTPAATLYNPNELGELTMECSISEITETDGTISFIFSSGTIDVSDFPKFAVSFSKIPVTDMQGRRINTAGLRPGIYITNGKKFIVK